MRLVIALSASLLAGGLTFVSGALAQPQGSMSPGQGPDQGGIPMDTPTTIGGIETVCTGIGSPQRQNPQWLAYPVRIEFANTGAQHVLGAHVDLTSSGGQPLASLDCHGPLVLFRLNPGTYRVRATLFSQPGGTASATFQAPRTGQRRVVLTFNVGPNQ